MSSSAACPLSSIYSIGTAGPTVDSPSHKSAWEWTRKNLEENPDFVYACDEHFYVPPKWLYDNADVYDGYPRKGLVYAANMPRTSWRRAQAG